MLSNPVKSAKPKRNAHETRLRLLNAARAAFSFHSYEHISLRKIASAAGVDAALISRYFGSKEGLFRAVVGGMFPEGEGKDDPPLENLGEVVTWRICEKVKTCADHNCGFEPFHIILRSAVNPVTSPILAEEIQKNLVAPLAGRLPGPHRLLRAGLIHAYAIGLVTMLTALQTSAIDLETDQVELLKYFGQAIQFCADRPEDAAAPGPGGQPSKGDSYANPDHRLRNH